MSLTILIPIGALVGHLWEKHAARSAKPEFTSRMGVLLATGFIVGESLFGVLFAGIVAGSGSDAPLAVVGENFATAAILIGLLLFVGTSTYRYRRTRAAAASAPSAACSRARPSLRARPCDRGALAGRRLFLSFLKGGWAVRAEGRS